MMVITLFCGLFEAARPNKHLRNYENLQLIEHNLFTAVNLNIVIKYHVRYLACSDGLERIFGTVYCIRTLHEINKR